MKYIHLCMLMYVQVDFNLVQLGADICGLLVYIYIYIYIVYVYLTNCFYIHFVFTLFCAHN